MTTAGKTGVGIVALIVAIGGVYASVRWSQRDLVVVQTTAVARQDLTAVVTASGEIKPKTYINLGANATGPITELLVKEGDRSSQEPGGGADREHPAPRPTWLRRRRRSLRRKPIPPRRKRG